MYDLIIVGGGAAGLSAAIYALGKRLHFLIIYEQLGGKAGGRQHLTRQNELEYLAGEEAVRQFEHTLQAYPERTQRDRVVRIEHAAGFFRVVTEHYGTHTSTTVIVATGAVPRRLDVPGARDLLGQGLGYSVTTHAHLLAHKAAVVIGGTGRALRGVAELARTAAQVYLIIPDWSPLGAPMVRAVQHFTNVHVLAGFRVCEVVGPGSLTEVVVEHDGQEQRLRVDAAFVDLGLVPNSSLVQGVVQIDDEGYVVVDQHNATSLPGLFAAGDVTSAPVEQVLIAIGDGARAAVSAYDYHLLRTPIQRFEGAD